MKFSPSLNKKIKIKINQGFKSKGEEEWMKEIKNKKGYQCDFSINEIRRA